MPDGPLIVQSDKSLLLEVDHPLGDAARHAIAPFAELERAPEHIHTYRLTNLGLWNARAAGLTATEVTETLQQFSRYPVPSSVLIDVAEIMGRYGRLTLRADGDEARARRKQVSVSEGKEAVDGDVGRTRSLANSSEPKDAVAGSGATEHERSEERGERLVLEASDPAVLAEVQRSRKTAGLLGEQLDSTTVVVPASERGHLKQALIKLGWPADDQAGYVSGEHYAIELRQTDWKVRDYQARAVDAYWFGGSGIVVLPCGAGKTIVGAAAMAKSDTTTLILVTNTVAARQWRDELLRRTDLAPDAIGEYSGAVKEIKPVTIATYQVLTTRRGGAYTHMALLDARDWGLIIYDEVHLLPAPVFRLTADLQARRRLGLTATLVREDGREDEVFSMIGPKRYDAPWKDLEQGGYIAPAVCVEVRLTLPDDERMRYAIAEPEERYRLAATATEKVGVVQQLVALHPDERILVIGQYLDQLAELARVLDAPLITGEVPVKERQRLYAAFRTGEISLLVVSKVANFSIDLPEASVAIQVSGAFGSRQEEAQRLGRIMRPKADGRTAHFYAIVTRDTVDQDFAAHRQRFLAEQGYQYSIVDADAGRVPN